MVANAIRALQKNLCIELQVREMCLATKHLQTLEQGPFAPMPPINRSIILIQTKCAKWKRNNKKHYVRNARKTENGVAGKTSRLVSLSCPVLSATFHLAAVCLLAMANVLRVTRWAPRPRMVRTAVWVPVSSSVTHSCFAVSARNGTKTHEIKNTTTGTNINAFKKSESETQRVRHTK